MFFVAIVRLPHPTPESPLVVSSRQLTRCLPCVALRWHEALDWKETRLLLQMLVQRRFASGVVDTVLDFSSEKYFV